MDRRTLLKSALTGAAALALHPALAISTTGDDAEQALAALEKKHGGRLGVSILDTGTGRRIARRGDERFLMCSTFKFLAVAAVLARVDQGKETLERRIVFGKDVLLAHAPVTREHVGAPGVSVAVLCQAAITVSDNTAANLLLESMGGPAALTTFIRGLGDQRTRLDRMEPELNVGSPGDLRDTTTPTAMLDSMRKVLLTDVLSASSRAQLIDWLRATSTGTTLVRAGLPANWNAGDKTGRGAAGEVNDIVIAWPPRRQPVLVAVYYVQATADDVARNAMLAAVGRIAAAI